MLTDQQPLELPRDERRRGEHHALGVAARLARAEATVHVLPHQPLPVWPAVPWHRALPTTINLTF